MKLVLYTNKDNVAITATRVGRDKWKYTTFSGRSGITSTRAMSVLMDSVMSTEDRVNADPGMRDTRP